MIRPSTPLPPPRVQLGTWIDDPPSLVLRPDYLDRLRALPLDEVAVMADGPRPGLEDLRWSPKDLEELARALPHLRRTVTVWVAAEHAAIEDLRRRLPELIHALEAHGVEGDAEPAGHWDERDVRDYVDRDHDGHRLDEAADALAEAFCGLPVREVATTGFPGAWRYLRPLVEALAARAPGEMDVRLWAQLYAVRHRSAGLMPFECSLGPRQLPRHSVKHLSEVVPSGVEVCAGLAAYDTTWPRVGNTMGIAARAAVAGGAHRIRWWSSKWLVRMRGHGGRAQALHEIAAEHRGRLTS